jgi:hypothetical protein
MGLFSGIKKAVKSVYKGAKKVFNKVMTKVGKITGSKWGKALMIAGAAVMGGIALYGAYTGWTAAAANATFGAKVAAAVKGMTAALGSPIATGKEMLGAAGAAGSGATAGANAAQAANAVGAAGTQGSMGALGTGGTGLGEAVTAAQTAGNGAAAFGAPEGFSAIGQAGLQAGQAGAGAGAGAGTTGGLLSKAGKAAWDFAKSPGGAQIISGVVSGIGEAKMKEKELEQDWEKARYYDKQWRDPQQLAMFQNAAAQGVTPPTNAAARQSMLAQQYGGYGTYGPPPSPEQLAAYARGY